ncbi:MAG: ribosome recycling factor [Candidatus Levybacteria bacterium]|nr:ribosome recycling factor [Candidatus Levybacteria bacterium]
MDGQISQKTKTRMQKAYEVLKDDFGTVKTGKANPQLVENIVINAYGGSTRLKVMELATIHTQDAQTILITPFDQSVLGDIERGISESQMGLGLAVDGANIRVTIPPLTQERREEFVKLIHKKTENGKIMIRQARAESKDEIEKLKKEGHISEDDVERLEKEVQKITDEYIAKIDETSKLKEKELLTV